MHSITYTENTCKNNYRTKCNCSVNASLYCKHVCYSTRILQTMCSFSSQFIFTNVNFVKLYKWVCFIYKNLFLYLNIFLFSFDILYISPLLKDWSTIKWLLITVFRLINFIAKYRALYLFPSIWPSTPNFTISMMYYYFYTIFSKSDCLRALELNETFDNSPKEYKNTVYLAWACLKVMINWFTRGNHFYLMSSHSHDTQDQVWKVIKIGMC
jgi:hypothetical protein